MSHNIRHQSFQALPVQPGGKTVKEKIIKKKPFKNLTHGKVSYLIVTFMKKKPREVYTVVDLSKGTPDMMLQLEKKHGKEITTRTWKTVGRIQEKLSKSLL